MFHPQIAAVILQYGNWQKTAESVASLVASTLRPAWIIVVDNNSPDDSAMRLEQHLLHKFPDCLNVIESGQEKPNPKFLNYLKLKDNRGYAAGNNAGLRLASQWNADAYFILNNDAKVKADALEAMWKRMSQSGRPGICGPLLVYPGKKEKVQCCAGGHTNYVTGLSFFSGADLTLEEAKNMDPALIEKDLNFICGACALVSRDFIKTVGLMDEGFFLYCEEQDWAIRAEERFDFLYAPGAIVYHDEGAATGWNRNSFAWTPAARLFASRLRLAWRHHPWYMPTVVFGSVYAAIRQLTRKMLSLSEKS